MDFLLLFFPHFLSNKEAITTRKQTDRFQQNFLRTWVHVSTGLIYLKSFIQETSQLQNITQHYLKHDNLGCISKRIAINIIEIRIYGLFGDTIGIKLRHIIQII